MNSIKVNKLQDIKHSPSNKKDPIENIGDLSTGGETYKKAKCFSSAVKNKSCLPRPDFSTLEKKERTLEFKEPGSYKKAKVLFPKSPLKSPKKNYITPNSCNIGNFKSNLFSNEKEYDVKPSACRKLNFFDDEQHKERKANEKSDLKSPSSFSFNFKKPAMAPITNFLDCLKEENDDEETATTALIENKNYFDSNYIILKTISQDSKYNELFKCVEVLTKKITTIKKSKKKAPIKQIIKILTAIKDETTLNPFSYFILSPLKIWTENDEMSYKSTLYINEKYFENGDVLDHLSKLEQMNSLKLKDPSFYWDLFFDMLCGLHYMHSVLNVIHFNVQPCNYLIDDKGHAVLTGFSHSRKFAEKESFDDLIEGDTAYIAPEIFNHKKDINYKSDVFSLGLSFLEIMSKVELPENGEMWRDIRSENFKIPKDLYEKWNVKEEKFLNLIEKMICFDINKRPMIIEIFEKEREFPEIHQRYMKLIAGEMDLKVEDERLVKMEDIGNYGMIKIKRSNSYKFDF